MPIIDAAYVKARWDQWEAFCTLDRYDPQQAAHAVDNPTPDMVLEQAVADGVDELTGFVPVTEAGATAKAKQLAMRLAKKHAFDQKHGDDGFEHDPQILKDYRAAVRELEAFRDGGPPLSLLETPTPTPPPASR